MGTGNQQGRGSAPGIWQAAASVCPWCFVAIHARDTSAQVLPSGMRTPCWHSLPTLIPRHPRNHNTSCQSSSSRWLAPTWWEACLPWTTIRPHHAATWHRHRTRQTAQHRRWSGRGGAYGTDGGRRSRDSRASAIPCTFFWPYLARFSDVRRTLCWKCHVTGAGKGRDHAARKKSCQWNERNCLLRSTYNGIQPTLRCATCALHTLHADQFLHS